MTDLAPMTALGATAVRSQAFAALTLREDDSVALASLALRRGAAQPAPFGLALPGPGQWSSGQGVAAFWTGPGQWMIEAGGRADGDLSKALRAEAPGCSVTDQTDGWVCFEVASTAGPAPIARLMEKLFNIDTSSFGPGTATRTVFDHMAVFVIRRADDRLAVLGMRSAAGTLSHALETAAARVQP